MKGLVPTLLYRVNIPLNSLDEHEMFAWLVETVGPTYSRGSVSQIPSRAIAKSLRKYLKDDGKAEAYTATFDKVQWHIVTRSRNHAKVLFRNKESLVHFSLRWVK